MPDVSVSRPLKARSDAIAAPPVVVFNVRLFSMLLPAVKARGFVSPPVVLITRFDAVLPVSVPAPAILPVGFKVSVLAPIANAPVVIVSRLLILRLEPSVVTPVVVFITRLLRVLPRPVAKRSAPVRPPVVLTIILDKVLPVIVPVPVAKRLATGPNVSVWPARANVPDANDSVPLITVFAASVTVPGVLIMILSIPNPPSSVPISADVV